MNADARALVADTRSIWMQCSAVDFRWGAGVLIPIMGCWRFDSNNSVSTGCFLTFIYLMSSESRYLGLQRRMFLNLGNRLSLCCLVLLKLRFGKAWVVYLALFYTYLGSMPICSSEFN